MSSRIYSIESKINVKKCFLCSGFTEYYCHTCQKGLCQQCKADHVIDLATKRHKVTIYSEKFNIHKREIFVGNRGMICNTYCETCEVPVCDSWSDKNSIESPFFASIISKKHRKHQLVGIRKAYQAKRQQYKSLIHDIRSETLVNKRVLLKRIKSNVDTDVQTYQREISLFHFELNNRCQTRLKYLIDSVKDNVMICRRIKTSCLIQKKRLAQYIDRIQKYEREFEQSASRPVKFLQFVKTACLPQISDTPHLTQHYLLNLTQEINTKDFIKLLTGETLYNGLVLPKRRNSNVDTDVQTCRREILQCYSEIKNRCQREISQCHSEIKNRCQKEIIQCHSEIRNMYQSLGIKHQSASLKDNMIIRIRIKHNVPLQKKRLAQYIGIIQKCERRFELSADRPVKFVRSVKMTCLTKISDTPHRTKRYHLIRKNTTKNLIELDWNPNQIEIKTRNLDRKRSSTNPDAGLCVTEFSSGVRY